MSKLGLLDKAARAATALLVRRGYLPEEIGPAIHVSVPALGGASTMSRWGRYARACQRGSSKQSNRKWADYSTELKTLARKIADEAETLL